MILKVTPRAARAIESAVRRWRAEAMEPELLERELGEVFALLQEQPLIGAPFAAKRLKDVRRFRTAKSRYHVYYRLRADDAIIELLTIWHEHRGEAPTL